MKFNIINIIAVLLLMQGCSGNSKNSNDKNEQVKDSIQIVVDSLDHVLKKWRQDSLGTLGYRDECLREIFTKYPFKKRTCSDIVKDFGKPNFTHRSDTTCKHLYNLKCKRYEDGRISCEESCSIQCGKNDSITYRGCVIY